MTGDALGGMEDGPPRCVVEIHDAVDDGCPARHRIVDHVGRRERLLVEETRDGGRTLAGGQNPLPLLGGP